MMRGLLVVTVLAGGCGDNKSAEVAGDANQPDAGRSPAERGRYIMNNVAACTFCHTPLNPDGSRDTTRNLAGVDCFFDLDGIADNGFGCVSSRNLTNDPTGLMNFTDAQIKDAFRNGHRTDGKTLSPIMPYYIFHNMTDEDADAIVAYLRTVPGVNHTVQANEEPWASINNGGEATVAPYVSQSEIPLPAGGENNTRAMHGRYLSAEIGLCIDCHTPDAPMGSLRPIDLSMPFAGGRVFTNLDLGLQSPPYPMQIHVRNLTPDATGLADFSVDDIKKAIAEGKDKNGNAVCAATHGSHISPYAALDPEDLQDIAEYIHALPAISNDTAPNCEGPPVP